MIDLVETAKSFASSHFTAGAAGGFVRNVYIKEAWGVVAIRTFAGGVSAHFVTPVVLWFSPRFFELSQSEIMDFLGPAGMGVSFLVGLMGLAVSTVIEKLVNKKLGLHEKH